MKYKLIFFVGLVFLATNSNSQNYYHNSFGFKIGTECNPGLSLKHFINPTDAVELIGSIGHKRTLVAGLYERHFNYAYQTGFNWFYGIGGHAGFYRYNWRDSTDANPDGRLAAKDGDAEILGADIIIGADYKFRYAPITLGLDVKPYLDFYKKGASGYIEASFSLRYVF